jgi:CRP-like cAMP-binding protein
MSPLLTIAESDVKHLKNFQLRPLLNHLLKAEAKLHGIPLSVIEITDEDTIADDGIDAQVNNPVTVSPDCRIPYGLSVWQYKAGEISPSDIRNESQKPGIQKAVSNNGSYYFMVGQSCTDPMRRNREQALDEVFISLNKPARSRLFTAAEIAEWLSDYPAIASQMIGFQLPDEFYNFDQWKKLSETRASLEFQYDETRQNMVDNVSELLNSDIDNFSIRVGGVDGIGKTRLVLESIQLANAGYYTFYAVTPEAIPDNFFRYVQDRTSINKLILIVDECNGDSYRQLRERTQRCDGRVILITIGSEEISSTGELEPSVFYFQLTKLDNAIIRRVTRQIAPSLHPELHIQIAYIAEGYIKLALTMAESLSHRTDLGTVSELIDHPKVREEFIKDSLISSAEERSAMQALSVLRYIGLDDEVRIEGQIVAEFLGIDFGKLKRIARQMERRGLVVKQGRFRYVTPSVLAIWFAKELGVATLRFEKG